MYFFYYRGMDKSKFRFEYDIVDYCNLNCAGCSHYAPIGENKYVTSNQAEVELKSLANIIKDECDIIHIMGGEPLLNPEINEILKICRNNFPNTELQVVTNGILLDKMDVLFWKTCHDLNIKICLTLYPIKLKRDKIMAYAKMFNINIIPFRNGTSFNRYLIDENGKQDINKSYSQCNLKNCPLYKNNKLYPCTITGCVNKLNNYFNKNIEVTNNDYIEINNETTKEMIYDFLNKPIPFCKYCMVSEWDKKYEWSVSNKDIKEWVYEK